MKADVERLSALLVEASDILATLQVHGWQRSFALKMSRRLLGMRATLRRAFQA